MFEEGRRESAVVNGKVDFSKFLCPVALFSSWKKPVPSIVGVLTSKVQFN
jgi:hypothetical protein